MKILKYILIIIFALLTYVSLCGCNQKAELESNIKEEETKIISLQNDLEHYQQIYNDTLSTYNQYKKYSGQKEWDSELSRTEEIINDTERKIYELKREIDIINAYIKTQKEKLANYD